MKKTSCKRTKNGYGSALLFAHMSDPYDSTLHVKVIKRRDMKPVDCLGQYIENTNLHSLPPNCLGVLVAYSRDTTKEKHLKKWSLGVILYLLLFKRYPWSGKVSYAYFKNV